MAHDTVQSDTVCVVHELELELEDESSPSSPSSSGGPSVTGSLVQLPTEMPKTLIHGKWIFGSPGKFSEISGSRSGPRPQKRMPTPGLKIMKGTRVVWWSASVVVTQVFPVNELSVMVTAENPGGGPVIVAVITSDADVVGLLAVEEGKKVNVSPSVVSVVGCVRPVGTVTVSVPPMIRNPEEDTTVWPSGSVMVIPPA